MNLLRIAFKGCQSIGSLFLFSLLLFTNTGCRQFSSDKKLNLHQVWYSTQFVSPDGLDLSRTNNRVLRFYKNGTYSLFSGEGDYQFGSWFHSTKNSTISLEPETGNFEMIESWWQYQHVNKALSAMVYRNAGQVPGTQEGSFSFAAIDDEGDHDPFDPAMHEWRIKPTRPETLPELKNRVLAYLSLQEALYHFLIDNEIAAFRTQLFPEPVLMHYSNGVRMAYADELASWNACFYDSAQAVKGYQFLSGAIYDVNLKKTNNLFERNLDCIEQLTHIIETKEIVKP
ncbi:MAG TPA: hypothetical protein VLC98_17725 [Phnomibacter sp.]|nr:hypothetical protein [Phnomibacter sp.]